MSAHPELSLDYLWRPAPDAAGSPGTPLPITLLVLSEADKKGDSPLAPLALADAVAAGVAVIAPTPPPATDAHDAAGALASFLTEAAEALAIDPGAIWGLGFGDGATLLTALAVDHPKVLSGLVVLSGRAPFKSPGGRVLDTKKTFCATGTTDTRVSEADYEQLVELLVTTGAEVQLHWYECGHDVTGDELAAISQFLDRWAGGSEADQRSVSGPGTG